ncbi:Acyl-coenzyme A oxidase 3 [Sparassis crispa]|uniref:Acyl-coenzyme A oxidase n=1 Tax=Sparassis crispa TaxID=139825 RepID=A0A401GXA2_9APHY|nr:Acyl-coenzyme A oxidase 3 [Sparassis crispa]GBE86858.1 Acyl-coenzyme A oxidase 3 [Sparassis crispa]
MTAKMSPLDIQNRLDMLEARAQTHIDVPQIRAMLYGGQDKWDTQRKIVEILSKDSVFDKSRRSFMTRKERYKRGLAMTHRVFELQEVHKWSDADAAWVIRNMDEDVAMVLDVGVFEPVVKNQGSQKLLETYGELIANKGIIGCYLQTELGHGTNVAGLETTATYLPETQEFDIHSPTLTSSKWWIGGLGKTATHGVVQAKLILPGGKDMGPHLFFIQLRSLKDHSVLPGIMLGDIGPKAMGGYVANDNGYARFNHVRIPRENMLSAFAQVMEDGRYVRPPHAKLSYGSMLYVRAHMISTMGWAIAKAATVSIRYATVRRQGTKGPDGLEKQVITYSSLYYRLLPLLSRAYVFLFLGQNLVEMLAAMQSQLTTGDTSLLAEMHATSSGLKILASATAIQDIETARRSMGGHGYSDFAGLGRLYADHLPGATYEGDNFVLDQQIVRAAVKSCKTLLGLKSTSALTPSTAYLRLLLPEFYDTQHATEFPEWDDPNTVIALLEKRAARIVEARTLVVDCDASMDQRVSRAATEAFVAVQVGKMIQSLRSHLAESEAAVLAKLFNLYLLTTVESGLVDLLSFGIFPQNAERGRDLTGGLRTAIKQLCLELLPEAIGLTDAFGFTDWQLDSVLGVYDGRVYEALWARAQTEPLNASEVPDGYEVSDQPLCRCSMSD